MKGFFEKVKAKLGALLWVALAALLMVLNFGVKIARAEAIIPTEQVITSTVIQGDQVQITGVNVGGLSANDGQFYLFELQPWEDGIGLRIDYAATASKGAEFSFSLPLNQNTSASRLYSKFVTAVWDGEKYVAVSQPSYITNPEAVAKNQNPFKAPLTKKGLLIEPSMLDDAFNLGVKHVIVNFPFQFILGSGIDYEYEGKTYHFNKALLDEYDKVVRNMTAKDLSVTAVILNSWNPATPDLYYPGVQQQAGVNYYMFNASTQAGFEDIKAIASFLAEHYSGIGNGKVSNWIIGNEINNQEWNYIGPMALEQYVAEYERAFRVFYTAIKSTSANDRVYFSTDFYWNYNGNGTTKYGAKEIVDSFNARIQAGGQIDWNLAYHPYSFPMTEPEFWDDEATGLVNWRLFPEARAANRLRSGAAHHPVGAGLYFCQRHQRQLRGSSGGGHCLCLLYCRQQPLHRRIYYEPPGGRTLRGQAFRLLRTVSMRYEPGGQCGHQDEEELRGVPEY